MTQLSPPHEPVADAVPARSSAGRRGTGRWLPPLIGVLSFLLVLGVGSVLTIEWGTRNAEMRRLVTAVEASEAAMTQTQISVAEALDAFEASDGGEAAKMELDSTLTAAADEGHRQIEAAGRTVASVDVLPWHTRIIKARDAYLAHNRAWQEYLLRATDDPGEFDREQLEVNSTFEAVEPLMRGALPNPPLFDLEERVDAIFAPPVSGEDLQSA